PASTPSAATASIATTTSNGSFGKRVCTGSPPSPTTSSSPTLVSGCWGCRGGTECRLTTRSLGVMLRIVGRGQSEERTTPSLDGRRDVPDEIRELLGVELNRLLARRDRWQQERTMATTTATATYAMLWPDGHLDLPTEILERLRIEGGWQCIVEVENDT